ncbi:citrulline utilization hydrolase CtlX [Micropruina sp.]|uniref:citrulline utilization hydrolase CtlX n=1 Tax=Micropruina sp. TaxID=2737536 RepID=UPI0039E464F4
MNFRHAQAPPSVVMVRPHRFRVNAETLADNTFQAPSDIALTDDQLATRALEEFDGCVAALTHAGVGVHVFDDFGHLDTPDSVFPNNWFSTHHGGRIAVYPMFAPNRRRERRFDVIELLKRCYRVQEVIDYSGLEYDNLFLEGTGAMVFDHLERVAYVANSYRADPVILERFCTAFGYEPMAFATAGPDGRPIYHTNVLMGIASEYALVCLDAISDPRRRDQVAARLAESGRTVLELSFEQVAEFAGNTIELTGTNGRVLALSQRATAALTDEQRAVIEESARLLPLRVPTIELAGGSVRCMIAGVHLTPR